MKTYNKAQEIFNKKLNPSVLRQSQKSSINVLKYTSNSTIKLYNLYLYNKFLRKKFKNLYNSFLFNKKRRYLFINAIKKVTFLLNKIKEGIKLKKITFWSKTSIEKEYSKIIFSLLSFTKNFVLFESTKKLKLFLLTLRWIAFSSSYTKKVFFQLKLKKYIKLLKNQLKIIKNLNLILKIKSKFKLLSLKYLGFIKDLFINYRWSNKTIILYWERIYKTFLVYGIPFLILVHSYVNSLYSCRPHTESLINKLKSLFPTLMLFVDKKIAGPLFNYVPLAYISLTLSARNRSTLPKSIGKDMVIGTTFLLINFAIENLIPIFDVLTNSFLSLIDIYFSKAFFRSEKIVWVLRFITNIITNDEDIVGFYASRFWPRGTVLYDLERKGLVFTVEPSWELGRYERFTTGIANYFLKFLGSSFYTPIYLIIIISLLYNWCYYVISNKRPYLPLITELGDKLTPPKFTD